MKKGILSWILALLLPVILMPARADIGRLSYQSLVLGSEKTEVLERREADYDGKLYPYTGMKNGTRDATVMIYLCGSDLESPNRKGFVGGGATRDLKEIIKSGYNQDRITVLIMAGGSTKWYNDAVNASETGIYEVVGNSLVKRHGSGLLDMSRAETLRDFVNFGYERFPAEKYGLVIWDHAKGPVHGLVDDDVSGNSMPSILTVAEALSQSPFAGRKLQWMGFDACLMGSVEIAKVMSPYADYMIASEESEPNYGWNYSFLKGLESDEDPVVTGTRIVNTCMEQYSAGYSREKVTLACYDLRKLEGLEVQIDAFFSNLCPEVNSESFPRIAALRQGMESVDSPETDLVDIRHMVEALSAYSPDLAGELLQTIDETIVAEIHNTGNGSGLSTYFPYYQPGNYQKRFSSLYSALGYAENYVKYLNLMNQVQMAEPLASWQNLAQGIEVRDTRTRFSVQLTDEQIAQLAESKLVMLQEREDEAGNASYAIVNPEGQSELDGNTLSGEYTHKALFAVDANGDAIDELPLSWTWDAEKRYLIPARLLSGEDGVDIQLVCVENGDGEMQIQSIRAWDERSGYYSDRYEVDPEDFDTIAFTVPLYRKTRDGEDVLKGVMDWDTVEAEDQPVYTLDIRGDWTLRMLSDAIDENALCAAFVITDCQQRAHTNELVYIVPRGSANRGFVLKYKDDYVVISSNHVLENNDGYYLLLSLENPGEQEVFYHIENVVLDGAPMGIELWIEGEGEYLGIPPGERGDGALVIDGEQAGNLRDTCKIAFDIVAVNAEDDEPLTVTPVTGHLTQPAQ